MILSSYNQVARLAGHPVQDVKARHGAKGDGVADDTTAVQSAIDAAAEQSTSDVDLTQSRGGGVFIPGNGPTFRITGKLTIPARAITIYGVGEGSRLVLEGPGAYIESAPASGFHHALNIHDLMLLSSGAAKAVRLVNTEECEFRNVFASGPFSGTVIELDTSGIFRGYNVRLGQAPVLLSVRNSAQVAMHGGNFYSGTAAAIKVIGDCPDLSINQTWFEANQLAFLFDNSVGSTICAGAVSASACRFTSTLSQARVAKFVSTTAANPLAVPNFIVDKSTLYHTASDYLFEAVMNSFVHGANSLGVKVNDCGRFFGGATALMTSDWAGATLRVKNSDWNTSAAALVAGSAKLVEGWYGAAPVVKPTITGSRGGNAALASLLTQLASQGIVIDGTSA